MNMASWKMHIFNRKYIDSIDFGRVGQVALEMSFVDVSSPQVHRRGAGSRLMAKAAHLEGIVRCMLLGNMSMSFPFYFGSPGAKMKLEKYVLFSNRDF